MTTAIILASSVFGLILLIGLFGSLANAAKPLLSIPNFKQAMDEDFEAFIKTEKHRKRVKNNISYLAGTLLGANFMILFII